MSIYPFIVESFICKYFLSCMLHTLTPNSVYGSIFTRSLDQPSFLKVDAEDPNSPVRAGDGAYGGGQSSREVTSMTEPVS